MSDLSIGVAPSVACPPASGTVPGEPNGWTFIQVAEDSGSVRESTAFEEPDASDVSDAFGLAARFDDVACFAFRCEPDRASRSAADRRSAAWEFVGETDPEDVSVPICAGIPDGAGIVSVARGVAGGSVPPSDGVDAASGVETAGPAAGEAGFTGAGDGPVWAASGIAAFGRIVSVDVVALLPAVLPPVVSLPSVLLVGMVSEAVIWPVMFRLSLSHCATSSG